MAQGQMRRGSPAAGEPPAPKPRISIVIPVHGVQDELPACLASILTQSYGGIEVIAVDDRSPDRCGEILDSFARTDPRVRVIHLGAATGPGGARNVGLGHAAGDYVWFVDGDDLLADGALAAVAGRLARTEPDVLLVGFSRLQPSGTCEPNAWRHLLGGSSAGAVFTLRDRPEVIRLTMASWGKVIRREFLNGLGLRFEPGIHEDVPVTCETLMNAARIATLDRVCYLYRQRRGGALTAAPTRENFQIFARYEDVFAAIGSGPADLRSFWPVIFDRAIWHYTTVLGSRHCLPRRARREFFARMTEHFRRFHPERYTYPSGWRAIKYALVRRGAYRTYRTLEAANRARILARAALRAPRYRWPRDGSGHRLP